MSKPINDGGPAFPTTPVSHGYGPESGGLGTGCSPGMTLRDWFAGQALAGLLSEPKETPEMPHRYAKASYIMADAMLKARGGGS